MTQPNGDQVASSQGADQIVDPVCGMLVKAESSHRSLHGDQTVLFCSARCKAKFDSDPHAYLRDSGVRHEHAFSTEPIGSKWTCPMHSQIVRDAPGACPICGMALEPMTPSADRDPNPELADMTRRFWIGSALAAPVFVLEMGGHLLGGHLIAQQTSHWI